MRSSTSAVVATFLVLAVGVAADTIDYPAVDCLALNTPVCEHVCTIFPGDSAGELDASLASSCLAPPHAMLMSSIQAANGTAEERIAYVCDPGSLGSELLACLTCISDDLPGYTTSYDVYYWANVCDQAWFNSTSAAVAIMGQEFEVVPAYSCQTSGATTITPVHDAVIETPGSTSILEETPTATLAEDSEPTVSMSFINSEVLSTPTHSSHAVLWVILCVFAMFAVVFVLGVSSTAKSRMEWAKNMIPY